MRWWVHGFIESGQTTLLVSWIFWVIFSICLHELAHGWAALWQGDDTPRRLNRMTMNPLVHMGGMSLLMFAIIGIAWGMMPVDPSRFRDGRRGRVFVAAAGPAMNIALAIVSLTAAALWVAYAPSSVSETVQNDVLTFLFAGGWLNIVLAAFNLLPVPPLDGSQILCGLSLRCYQFFQNPQAQMFGLFIVLAVFITGLGSGFFILARSISDTYVSLLVSLLT